MEARPQFAVRLLPSLADFAFLMPIAFLFGRMDGVRTLLSDCDTGWHIRTGEWIIANGWVPMRDIFSFSKPGSPWFAWEWLSDVLFARLNAMGGLQAVVMFTVLMLSVTFGALFLLVRRKANPIVAIAVTVLAAAGSSIHWLARPHLFTLLFLVLFYAALEQVKEGRTHLMGVPILGALPVATILWTNLHGGFFVGTLMIMAYGGGELLQLVFSPKAENHLPAWFKAGRYFVSGLACLAASLINPYTYHLHVHMAQYLRDPWNSEHIMEFFSPSFHHPTAIYFEAMLVMSVAAAIWNLRQGRFTEALLVFVWAHGGLLAARNIPIFMIAAAPPVAAAIQQCLLRVPELNVAVWFRAAAGKFNRLAVETAETDSIGRLHLVSILGVLLVAALVYAPHPPKKFRAEFDPIILSRRCPGYAAKRPGRAGIHQRRMGRLSDLPPLPVPQGLRGRPERFLRRRFRSQVYRRSECEVRLGEDSQRLRRRHDFIAPERAAERRVEGIQPLARRVRRRHRAGVPVRKPDYGHASIRRQAWRRRRP